MTAEQLAWYKDQLRLANEHWQFTDKQASKYRRALAEIRYVSKHNSIGFWFKVTEIVNKALD